MTVNELISLLENKNVGVFLYDGGGDITEITPDMVDLSIDDRIDIPALDIWGNYLEIPDSSIVR